jgi:hypothetical protein
MHKGQRPQIVCEACRAERNVWQMALLEGLMFFLVKTSCYDGPQHMTRCHLTQRNVMALCTHTNVNTWPSTRKTLYKEPFDAGIVQNWTYKLSQGELQIPGRARLNSVARYWCGYDAKAQEVGPKP